MTGTQKTQSWHSNSVEVVMKLVNGNVNGLGEEEAQRRLTEYGFNQLPQKPPPRWWQILLRQFRSPLIYVLAIATLVSLAIGDVKDAGFITGVLAINALIGGYQEWRAEKSSRALQQLLKIRAIVIRDGEVCEIDAEQVVPGDIVWLESGNRIPADMRLLGTHNLQIDESLLTGESLPVLKKSQWCGEVNTPLAERCNMAYAGSIVVRGRGRGVVVSTAAATMVGELATAMLQSPGGRPPLLERMERFSRRIAMAVVIAATGFALVGILRHGYKITDMFMFGVALAVSAIPEGLPVALTVALAVATSRMAGRGAIVRRLPSVEGLGSCTLIASDKTGTLTCNELTVREICLTNGDRFEVTGEGFIPEGQVITLSETRTLANETALDNLARAAVLCNEADLHHRNYNWVWRGDPTDIALLSMAHKLGWNRETTLERYPQINEIPFEPEHQFAATYNATGDTESSKYVFVKGAPERVLEMCDLSQYPQQKMELATIAQTMAEQGYRVLALAEGTIEHLDSVQVPPPPSQLTCLGFVGMIDPLRAGVSSAIAACHTAGIQVWMVTGDHPTTALAIAHDLGLATTPEQVITGTELAEQSPQQLQKTIENIQIFARVAPHQKLQLVNAARESGHFVAVTGDGVNDAPALRAANIGVAMGKSGTDIAREAAELVISDDHFATIVAGIEEGRVAYNNIRKVIYLLVSTGAAEVVLVGLGMLSGLPLPLLPVHLLWLNLVTNGIQDVALAFEPSEGDVLHRRPRSPKEPIFNRLMIERTVVAAVVMGMVGFSLFKLLLNNGWEVSSARNALLLLMVLFENIHIGNCRSEEKSVFQLSPLRSPVLLAGTVLAFLIHVSILYIPLGRTLLYTEPVGIETWGLLIALSLTVLIAIEVHKLGWYWQKRVRE